MMVLRLIAYFLALYLFCSGLAISAVAWSFYASVSSSFNLLKYTSDNKARDILATIARVAESKYDPENLTEMNDFFIKMTKQSEKDLDKFTIKEVFLISPDGNLLAHNNPKELTENHKATQKYNKPSFNRALRMRKGQLPTPQIFGTEEYKGDGSFVSNQLLKLFPELKYQVILLSAPIYHSEKLETVATIHLIYNRGNVLFFIESQKELFFWMLWNYILISLIISILLFGIYALFLFGAYKQAARKFSNLPEPILPKTIHKISTIFEKQEDTLNKYLTPIALKTETLQNLVSLSELVNEENKESSPEFNKIDLSITEVQIKPVDPKQTEAMDAIYLD
jgi:hypothetical protein